MKIKRGIALLLAAGLGFLSASLRDTYNDREGIPRPAIIEQFRLNYDKFAITTLDIADGYPPSLTSKEKRANLNKIHHKLISINPDYLTDYDNQLYYDLLFDVKDLINDIDKGKMPSLDRRPKVNETLDDIVKRDNKTSKFNNSYIYHTLINPVFPITSWELILYQTREMEKRGISYKEYYKRKAKVYTANNGSLDTIPKKKLIFIRGSHKSIKPLYEMDPWLSTVGHKQIEWFVFTPTLTFYRNTATEKRLIELDGLYLRENIICLNTNTDYLSHVKLTIISGHELAHMTQRHLELSKLKEEKIALLREKTIMHRLLNKYPQESYIKERLRNTNTHLYRIDYLESTRFLDIFKDINPYRSVMFLSPKALLENEINRDDMAYVRDILKNGKYRIDKSLLITYLDNLNSKQKGIRLDTELDFALYFALLSTDDNIPKINKERTLLKIINNAIKEEKTLTQYNAREALEWLSPGKYDID